MSLLNVARWSVLAGGIVYGFAHDRTLRREAAEHKVVAQEKRREDLVKEAKAEYLKLHPRPAATTTGPVTDVNSPEFDLVKLIDWSVKNLDSA